MVRQELQFESNGKEKFALLILTLITRHTILINNKANCIVLSTVPDPFGRFSISKVQVDDKVYLCTKKI